MSIIVFGKVVPLSIISVTELQVRVISFTHLKQAIKVAIVLVHYPDQGMETFVIYVNYVSLFSYCVMLAGIKRQTFVL